MFYYSILVLLEAVGLYMVYWVLDTLPLQYYELLTICMLVFAISVIKQMADLFS